MQDSTATRVHSFSVKEIRCGKIDLIHTMFSAEGTSTIGL